MVDQLDADDLWANVQAETGDGVAVPALSVERRTGIVPLDAQFGVSEPSTVPPKLYDVVFGQPEPTEVGVVEQAGSVPVLSTYVILDAALNFGLPEMLETSGLEHDCLFSGGASDELRDVAPWIVKLEKDHSFTRGLFTQSDGSRPFWGDRSGIYLRSRDGLKDIRAHLRKFTKLRDEAGAWFYLRLYNPRVLRAFVEGAPEFVCRILSRPAPWSNLTAVTCLEDVAEIVRPSEQASKDTAPILLGAKEKIVLRQLTFEARTDALMARLDRGTAIAMSSDPDIRRTQKSAIVAALHRMHGYGFQQPSQQERWAVWEMFYGARFEQFDATLSHICANRNMESGDRFVAFQRRLEELYP